MKILLIGLGSIGKRHLANILLLGYNEVSVVSSKVALPEQFSSLQVFTTLEAALMGDSFDAAVICTPTAYHIDAITRLLKALVPNIYIEKPVSHTLDDIEEVIELANAYPNRIVVGFDLHFDPGLQKVKQLIDSKVIGNIVSVNAQVGQYLPDWRPAEDYRKGMSAQKQTGGGVMLDLVHEFDYLLWLCGSVNTVACMYAQSGALQIETEDVAEVLLAFKSGAIGTIHLDYLQQQLVRNCLITGTMGTIAWNLVESKVNWIDDQKEVFSFDYRGFERNNRFVEIMKSFLQNDADERLTNLHQGIKSLQLVLAAKTSSETRRFVQPGDFLQL